MQFVSCEMGVLVGQVGASVAVRDHANAPTILHLDRSLVVQRQGKHYVPVGLIHRDKDRGLALIEFPVEADSGAHRVWVPLSSLAQFNGDGR
jgi:hypothetical protein